MTDYAGTTTKITAEVLDQALADVSDVPSVDVEGGTPTVIFTGNYENPVNDLAEFLSHLQAIDHDLAEAARRGLEWRDSGNYSRGSARLNGLTLVGKSRYAEDYDDEEV